MSLPPETFEAYRDHGDPKVRISDGLDEAVRTARFRKETNRWVLSATDRRWCRSPTPSI